MNLLSALEALLQRIDKERNKNSEHILDGRVASYEEYRHRMGIKNGLTIAETVVQEFQQTLYQDDEKLGSKTISFE